MGWNVLPSSQGSLAAWLRLGMIWDILLQGFRELGMGVRHFLIDWETWRQLTRISDKHFSSWLHRFCTHILRATSFFFKKKELGKQTHWNLCDVILAFQAYSSIHHTTEDITSLQMMCSQCASHYMIPVSTRSLALGNSLDQFKNSVHVFSKSQPVFICQVPVRVPSKGPLHWHTVSPVKLKFV